MLKIRPLVVHGLAALWNKANSHFRQVDVYSPNGQLVSITYPEGLQIVIEIYPVVFLRNWLNECNFAPEF